MACGCASARSPEGMDLDLEATAPSPAKACHAPRRRAVRPVTGGNSRRSSSIAMVVGRPFSGLNLAAYRRRHRCYRFGRRAPPRTTDIEPYFPRTEDNERQRKRRNIIKQPEYQEPGQQGFLVELPQRHQHGRIENAEATRR